MDAPTNTAIESPCVNICELNAQDVCIGCGRSLNEIGDWMAATDDEKAQMIARATERLAAITALKA